MPPDTRQPLSVERSPWLRGVLRVPGDAAMTHLAVLAGAIARGESVVARGLQSAQTAATIRAVNALGAYTEQTDAGSLRIHGLGIGGLLEPDAPLEFGDSFLGVTLTMGLAGGYHFNARFTADPEVSSRSYATLIDGLRTLGCSVEAADRNRLPVDIHGPELVLPAELALPPAMPAAKAALLLAALHGRLPSVFVEPTPSWNHAERLLRRFGASVEVDEIDDGSRRIIVGGLPELRAQPIDVPADPSLAAIGVAAAAIVPGSEVTIAGVLLNPARTAVLSALMAMGARIEVQNLKHEGEEEVADLFVRHAPLRAAALAAHHVAPLVADLPMLAVAAAFADGVSVFYLPPGLPLLEHARLATLSQALAANGISNEVTEEAVTVAGGRAALGGARLGLDDPDIALAMLVLGMGAGQRVTLGDRSVIEERFPGFVAAFEDIGAGFVSQGAGG